MEPDEEPRYEYRVFGADLVPAARKLATIGDEFETETSSETYLVSRLNIDTNVKFRDADLEVKVLEARQGLFELWRPLLSAELPVAAEVFVDRVAPRLGIDLDGVAQVWLSADDILGIVNDVPALTAVDVEKRRTKYRYDGGFCEHTTVEIAGRSLETVAIETSDLESAQRLLEVSGLSTHPNESYPAFLQRLLFQSPDNP